MNQIAEQAEARLRSAWRVFFLIAAMKLFAIISALQLLLAAPQAGAQLPLSRQHLIIAVVVYTISLAVAVSVAFGLRAHRTWAKNLGLAYAVIQIFGLFLAIRFGPLLFLTGILGVIALITLLVASGLGAFENAETPPAPDHDVTSKS